MVEDEVLRDNEFRYEERKSVARYLSHIGNSDAL